MASLHVVFAIDEASKKHGNVSPKNSKKAWFPRATCGHGQYTPKCVCAPTTHPGSFRCRPHRVNSHDDRSSTTSTLHQPPGQSSPASKTVEAQ